MRRTSNCPRWISTLGAAALALSAGAAHAAGELRVLNWQGYGTDEEWATAIFEERTGVKVVHDNFNSEQEMLTKLRTSPGAYDVVLINSAFTCDAAREGLIEPVDTSKISNLGDLSSNMRDSPMLNCDGKVHGVAWVWGVSSFAFNTEKIAQRPDSIEILWDPSLAGRVGCATTPWRPCRSRPLRSAGSQQSLRSRRGARKAPGPEDPDTDFLVLEDEWNKHLAAGQFDIATYWSGSASRSKNAFGLPVEFVIPKEGAIGWLDGLSVATGAPNAEAAHAFIDFMVSPEFYVRWDTEVGAPASANAAANAELPADAFNRTVLGDRRP